MTYQLKLMGQLLFIRKMENKKIVVYDDSENTISYFQDFDMINSCRGNNEPPSDKVLKYNILDYKDTTPKGVRKINILC